MSKSAEAFRTIGEVADDLGVPKHVLRFWEGKFTHIRPMKRGGGRRYYRPEDMDLLRGIRALLHSNGYTIKGVQKLLRDRGVEYVKAQARPAATDVSTPVQAPGEAARKKPRRRNDIAPAPEGTAAAAAKPIITGETPAGLPTAVLAVIRDLETARAILLGEPLPHRDPPAGSAGREHAGTL